MAVEVVALPIEKQNKHGGSFRSFFGQRLSESIVKWFKEPDGIFSHNIVNIINMITSNIHKF